MYCTISIVVVVVVLVLILAVVGVVSFCNLIHNQAGFIFGQYACTTKEELVDARNLQLVPFRPEFQKNNAIFLGSLANNLTIFPCLHCPKKKYDVIPHGIEFDEIEIQRIWSTHVYAIIAHDPRVQVTMVYFTSLKSVYILSDIIFRNLRHDKKYLPDEKLKCHQGTFNVYGRVEEKLHKVFREKYLHRTRQLVFFGHSLGGCLATLAALDFQKHYRQFDARNVWVYTFAAPRLGNQSFVRYYNARVPQTYRVLNVMDGCTMLPVSDAKNLYEHAGRAYMLEYDLGMAKNHSIVYILKYLMNQQ